MPLPRGLGGSVLGSCPSPQLSLFSLLLLVVKRVPEHVQVDDPAAQRRLAKKLERQQVQGAWALPHAVWSRLREGGRLGWAGVLG